MPRRSLATPLIVANWKMQLSVAEEHERLTALKLRLKTVRRRHQAVVCPSFLGLAGAKRLVRGSTIKLGAQDVFWDEHGAYTGEISPLSLREVGADYVIIGHSERRALLGESDEMISRKVISALGHGLTPILCVGESAHDRNEGRHELVVRHQVRHALRAAPPPSGQGRFYIAYEPIWAVGTGEAASAEEATAMLAVIRQTLVDRYSLAQVDQSIRVLYGGSVDAQNVSQYVGGDTYHGALVGTASLDVDNLATLITNISEHF